MFVNKEKCEIVNIGIGRLNIFINKFIFSYLYRYKNSKYFNPSEIVKRCIWLYNVQVSVCFGITGIMVMTNVDAVFRDPVCCQYSI